jgi:hypothetical protein
MDGRMLDIINHFRACHGCGKVRADDIDENMHCLAHSNAMANAKQLYHADATLLNDWGEAVAMCSCDGDWGEIENRLIFDVLGKSEPHSRILLEASQIAYGFTFKDGLVYLTVRGKK